MRQKWTFFSSSLHQWDFYICCLKILCEFWCTRTVWSTFLTAPFTLWSSVWPLKFNFVTLTFTKKILLISLLIYIAWHYYSTRIFAQQKSLFSLPDLVRICLMPCKSQVLAWAQDGWCEVFPMFFSHSFTLIILGVAHSIYINTYSVPGAWAYSILQGWNGMVFQIQPHLHYYTA